MAVAFKVKPTPAAPKKSVVPKRYELEDRLTFTPTDINGCIMIIGPGGTGKTNIVQGLWLANQQHYESRAVILCNSPAIHINYSWVDERCRFKYSKEQLQDILDAQEALNLERRRLKQPLSYLFLVFDDMGKTLTHYDKVLGSLASTTRHYCITPVFLLQETVQAPPACRANSTMVFGSELGPKDRNYFRQVTDLFRNDDEAKIAFEALAPYKSHNFLMRWKGDPSGKGLRVFKFPRFL